MTKLPSYRLTGAFQSGYKNYLVFMPMMNMAHRILIVLGAYLH